MRSTEDKVLTGLCGGLGRALAVDPIVFRIAFVVLALAGGTGVLLYLAGWLLVPDDRGVTEVDRFLGERSHNVALIVLAAVGVLLVLDRVGDHRGGGDFPLALVLIGVGAAVLWSRHNRTAGPSGPPPVSSSPPPVSPSPPSTSPSPPPPSGSTLADAPPADAPPGYAPPATGTPTATAPAGAFPGMPAPPTRPASVHPKPPPSALVPATLSLLLVLAGFLALLGVSLVTGLALALLVTGIALVIGAWRGRARLLIPVAILLAALLATVSFVDVPLDGGVGDRAYRPATLGQLDSPYRIGMGDLELDLSDLDLAGRQTEVLVTAGIGHVEVIVPPSVPLVVVGHVGLGEVEVFGATWGGTGVDERVVVGGREGAGRLTLRARVGIGQVEVRRAAA